MDRTPVLSLGKHLVSSYQVDKNYQRFLISVSQTDGGPPSSGEIQAWFTRFIDQQILIGHALEEGFGERQEVQTELLRMERHMLTQIGGPFYEKLFGEEKRDLDLKDAYRKSKKIVSVEVVRVPLSAPCANDLAIDRLSSTALDEARNSGAVIYYQGDLAWPYLGFEDLAAELENANEPKSWWQFESAGLRVIARVIAVKTRPDLPFDQVESTLRRLGEEAQKRALRASRKKAILAQYQFEFDWSGLQAFLKQNKTITPEIDQNAMAPIKNKALATIKRDGAISAVTIADYIAYHNALYIKGAPNTAIAVFSEMQDLIVAKQDYYDAIAAGVANQAKFSEDRDNFRNYLALDLYEKEKVRPGIAVTEERVRKYYQSHQADYLEPVKIEGRMLSFKTPDEASAYVKQIQSGSIAGKVDAVIEEKKIALTKDNIAQFLPPVPWPIATDSRIKAIGPLAQPDGKEYHVWRKETVVESSLQPLALVAPRIRAALEQPLLDKQEAALAHDLALKLSVYDRIDYRRYGINPRLLSHGQIEAN